jgi:hypothetical protein
MIYTDLAKLTSRWADKVGARRFEHSPDAKVVTGDYKLDTQLHNFEQDSGVVLQLSKSNQPRKITGYEVVDEKKWTWFLLEMS